MDEEEKVRNMAPPQLLPYTIHIDGYGGATLQPALIQRTN